MQLNATSNDFKLCFWQIYWSILKYFDIFKATIGMTVWVKISGFKKLGETSKLYNF